MNTFAFRSPMLLVAGLAALAAASFSTRPSDAQQGAAARSRIAFDRTLPAMDGQHLNMKVVEVRYGPGEASTPHRHGCAVVVYVMRGAVRMAVRGGPDSVYRQGETFHERPADIHQVSANASATDSAHFTATFVCDHTGPLTTPVPGAP